MLLQRLDAAQYLRLIRLQQARGQKYYMIRKNVNNIPFVFQLTIFPTVSFIKS
jgi:hypothetical protein